MASLGHPGGCQVNISTQKQWPTASWVCWWWPRSTPCCSTWSGCGNASRWVASKSREHWRVLQAWALGRWGEDLGLGVPFFKRGVSRLYSSSEPFWVSFRSSGPRSCWFSKWRFGSFFPGFHPTRPKKRCSALEGCCNLFQPVVSDAADGYALDPTDAWRAHHVTLWISHEKWV